mmetsp:Transcript_23968/g.61796  ORF Transcript_23968/g.61796 Transcript_23968/m.61796 type:complete len:170 (+) Transcript_23968:3-512(+)
MMAQHGLSAAESLIRVRLAIPEPPRRPHADGFDGSAATPIVPEIDLALEHAAIAREQAHAQNAALLTGANWPSDEDIASSLQHEVAQRKSQAVARWVERGYAREDAEAAVATNGIDDDSVLAFMSSCTRLRDELGFDASLARTSLAACKGDEEAAIHRCLQIGGAGHGL